MYPLDQAAWRFFRARVTRPHPDRLAEEFCTVPRRACT